MENQAQKSKLMELNPIPKSNLQRTSGIPFGSNPHSPNEEILKLQNDVIDVLEKRVDINSFPKEYQEKIKNYYKFSGTAYVSSKPVVAKRTNNTLDIV
jgi:hypothetical protein